MKTPEEIKHLAKERFPNDTPSGLKIGTSSYKQRGFIEGYTDCQKDMADKKYTEQQVRNLVDSVTEFMSHNEPDEFNEWFEKKLIKLQSPNKQDNGNNNTSGEDNPV